MQVLYTDIHDDISRFLVTEAIRLAEEGKRVFYLAPNAQSFEKERAVLSQLPQKASFAITITRFAQMARYFVLNRPSSKKTLDDVGLSMILYRVLSQFSDGELAVFGRLTKDMNFIQQLLDLYKELQSSQLSVLELTELDTADKQADFIKIFTAFERVLQSGGYDTQTKIGVFSQAILAGELDDAVKDLAVVIDGFTRFSAEEEQVISLLAEKGVTIIIGTYMSQKAYQNALSGSVYQASVDFVQGLKQKFSAQVTYVSSTVSSEDRQAFVKLTQLIENQYDYTQSDLTLNDGDKSHCELWEVVNQREEVEQVAKSIRHYLHEGYRYKDITVLLGDEATYDLQIGTIFDKYDIPYYLSKADSMAHHPLVNFVDALGRLKRYGCQPVDVVNLLQSGLYGEESQETIDAFAQYIHYAAISGQSGFFRPFTIPFKDKKTLDKMESVRQAVFSPLEDLFKVRKQSGQGLLRHLMTFLSSCHLAENMASLAQDFSEVELERHEQVWRTFTSILEQFETIFGHEKLTLSEFLELLRSGMMAATYRMIPATVDRVGVKSYTMIEPHANKIVFAIGLTQSHFPKIASNQSLLSDEERLRINHATSDDKHLEVKQQEMVKWNHFTALSLFNAATEQLILTYPTLLNEQEDSQSSYLSLLSSFGIPTVKKGATRLFYELEDIGNYKSLLSGLLDVNRLIREESLDLSEEDKTFWSVAVRYLRRRLAEQGAVFPLTIDNLQTQPISEEVMAICFPKTEPLSLSATAVKTFYDNQYAYFLKYVLGLSENETIKPDARQYGTYLHRVFELVMCDQSEPSFDSRLALAMKRAAKEGNFGVFCEQNAQAAYTLSVLEDIVRSTATILQENSEVRVLSEEASFNLLLTPDKALAYSPKDTVSLPLSEPSVVRIFGKIDRIDALADGSLGIVDYKSSDVRFSLDDFYNGLSPQLLSYLQFLFSKGSEDSSSVSTVFGAMYLHMREPKLDLKAVKEQDLVTKAYGELTYKGLFLEETSRQLPTNRYSLTKQSCYTKEELTTLLDYNRYLYLQAAEQIRQGHFLINPYTKDGKTVNGEQFKAITGFEANRHMPQARQLDRLPGRTASHRQDYLDKMSAKLQEGERHDL